MSHNFQYLVLKQLDVEKLRGGHGYRSVAGIDEVVDVVAVRVAQHPLVEVAVAASARVLLTVY